MIQELDFADPYLRSQKGRGGMGQDNNCEARYRMIGGYSRESNSLVNAIDIDFQIAVT